MKRLQFFAFSCLIIFRGSDAVQLWRTRDFPSRNLLRARNSLSIWQTNNFLHNFITNTLLNYATISGYWHFNYVSWILGVVEENLSPGYGLYGSFLFLGVNNTVYHNCNLTVAGVLQKTDFEGKFRFVSFKKEQNSNPPSRYQLSFNLKGGYLRTGSIHSERFHAGESSQMLDKNRSYTNVARINRVTVFFCFTKCYKYSHFDCTDG